MVVFAPRIDPALREQVEGIRGITGQTINQVGQEALRGWVESKLADDEIRNKAMADLDEEERRIQQRRESITRVLGGTASVTGGDEQPSDGRGNRRKRQD